MSYSGQIWSPPQYTSFTTLNAIAGTNITSVGNNIVLYAPPATGDNVVGQYITAPSTPYCIIANLVCNPGDNAGASAPQSIVYGLGFYDGTKLIWGGSRWAAGNTGMDTPIFEFANVSTLSARVFSSAYVEGYPVAMLQWFQVRDDGTNIYFYISTDAGPNPPSNWVKLYSQARTSYLTSPSKVFWGCDTNSSASNSGTYLTLNSWQSFAL